MADESELSRSRLARLLVRLPLVLSRHLWVWPLLGTVLLGVTGYWVHDRLQEVTRAELASRLTTLLHADVAALNLWFSEQEADARSFAADPRIQGAIRELELMARSNTTPMELINSEPARTLHRHLQPLLETQHYLDYVAIGKDRRILASPRHGLVGHAAPRPYERFLAKSLAGNVGVSPPFAWEPNPGQRAEGPTMFVTAPVKAADGSIIAALGLRMKPEEEFSQIFSVARMGETGEAYAFDRRGMMLTASRFDPQLKSLGLIPNQPDATSILNLRLRELPANRALWTEATNSAGTIRLESRARARRPLTRMAAAATAGHSGVDVQGYQNYRGQRVVGAWAWLPEYEMGVATEVETNEAFRLLYMMRTVFLVLLLLLALTTLGIFLFTLAVERLQSSVRKSALAAKRLGQYVLVREIGRGATGMVYYARHTLLRRPVAVKLLDPNLTNEANSKRFEHEVQITSQLTHPNTVAIYDYGHSPEGLFYYAMEYLEGIDLDRLVRQFGPQPEGRVLHVLQQICGSLAEAHRAGLIHRDIKPGNIFLTHRGGVCDIVKVLDFGLVKAVGGPGAKPDGHAQIEGTPHFMSPEAILHPDQVDARSDLYSLGAVAYWLISGRTLFEAEGPDALLKHHVATAPEPPSERTGRTFSLQLEELILRCLAKDPNQRPPSVAAFSEALAACPVGQVWTSADAEHWWQTHARTFEAVVTSVGLEKTLVIAPRTQASLHPR